MPVLVVNENGVVRVENLNQSVFKIGRDQSNDLHLDSMEVSRFHCQIQRLEEGFLITDLNSRNGTVVNGSYVRGVFLEDGDMVHIGDISLIFKEKEHTEENIEQLDAHQFKVIEEEKLEELELLAMERKQLLKLQKISFEVASVLEEDRLLRVALKSVVDLIGGDRGFVMLLDEKNRLKLRSEWNMNFKSAHPHEKNKAKELIQKVLKDRKVVIDREAMPNSPQANTRKTTSLVPNTLIVIPLKSMAWKARQKETNERRNMAAPFASEFLGIIYLASREEIQPFSHKDLNLIEATSHHISVALTNAKLHRMATVDKLTRLYNRGYFETLLQDEIRKATFTKAPLSLIITDIDHFKNFNDTHGHQIGDQVLHDVSQVIKNSLREDDIAARYGGEELVFLLPKTNASQAQIVAEKIRKAVEESRHTEKSLKVTISLGVAAFPEHADNPEVLVKRADQALYRAKGDGRNCWKLWEREFEEQGSAERTDKLAGILSGDQASNYRNTQLLLETINILNSDTNLDNLLEKLLDKILEITHAERAIIFLADPYGHLEFKSGITHEGESLNQVSMYSRSIPQKVFEEGKSVCMIDDGTDSSADSTFTPSQSMGRFQLSTVMCVSLQAQEQRFGVLYVDSHIAKGEFTPGDLIFLEALANQISFALHHAKIIEDKIREEEKKRKALEDQIQRLRKSSPKG